MGRLCFRSFFLFFLILYVLNFEFKINFFLVGWKICTDHWYYLISVLPPSVTYGLISRYGKRYSARSYESLFK